MIHFKGCCVHKLCQTEKVFEEKFVLHNVNKCSMRCTARLEPLLLTLLLSRKRLMITLVKNACFLASCPCLSHGQ